MDKKWDYKGVSITFNNQYEEFHAVVNGGKLRAPSLPAIRQKIDKALATTFTPFKAISGDLYDLTVFNVIGFEKSDGLTRSANRGDYVFITDAKSRNEKRAVVPATKENIAIVKAAAKEWEDCQDIIRDAEARHNKSREKIQWMRAQDYGTQKAPS